MDNRRQAGFSLRACCFQQTIDAHRRTRLRQKAASSQASDQWHPLDQKEASGGVTGRQSISVPHRFAMGHPPAHKPPGAWPDLVDISAREPRRRCHGDGAIPAPGYNAGCIRLPPRTGQHEPPHENG